MATTLKDLLAKVLSGYDANAKTFTLDSKGYGEESIKAVLKEWTGTPVALNGVKAKPVIQNNLISISGTASYLNVTDQPATITLGVLDSNGKPSTSGAPFFTYYFELPYGPDNKWGISTSFPVLKDSSLSQMAYQQSAFWLSSADFTSTKDTPLLKAGLNFQSARATAENRSLSVILGVLAGADHVSISGQITILSGNIDKLDSLIPGISLSTDATSLKFASVLTLPLTFSVNSRLAKKGDSVPPDSAYGYLALSSSVTVSSSVPPIGISADISNPGKTITLAADLADTSHVALQDLSKFLAHEPLTSSFAGLFNIGQTISLKTVRVYLALPLLKSDPSNALIAIGVDVGTVDNKKWGIVKGYVELDDLNFTFMLNYPTKAERGLNVIVDGDFQFPTDVKLSASGMFPEASFALNSLDSFSLTDLLTHFIPAAKGFPELTCDSLQMDAKPNEGPYDLTTEITSDWKVSAGAATIAFENATVSLSYDKSNSPAAKGALDASASITPAKGDPITTTVNWDIPGEFKLVGDFPNIDITSLARKMANVADLSLPSDFPAIAMTNANLALAIDSGKEYDFSLKADTEFDKTKLGVICEISKSDTGIGFIAGAWTENWSWSPADLWKDTFGALLSGISFSNSGLVISSLNEAAVDLDKAPATIPKTVQKGLTFFTAVDLGGGALSLLKKFFPDADGIDFYGVIGDPLSSSKLVGRIGQSSSTSKYSFDGLSFITNFSAASFTIQSGVTFQFHQIAGPNKGKEVAIDFIGGGQIALKPPGFELYFVVKAEGEDSLTVHKKCIESASKGSPPKGRGWKDPLGVKGVTIEDFWGEVGYSDAAVNFGFGGNIEVGTGDDQVSLELDIIIAVVEEVPDVEVFKFVLKSTSGKQINLTSLIKTFTTLDLSKIPILDKVSLKDFELFLVSVPGGWTNPVTQTHYPAGFYTSGDVIFYGLEAVFDIEVIYTSGIKASGSLSKPISLGKVLTISDAAEDGKGPYGSINTTNLASGDPYLTLSGKISLLDVSDSIEASIKDDAFSFKVDMSNPLYTADMECSLSDGVSFKGSVSIKAGIKCSPSIPVIGTLHIDDEVNGSLSVDIDSSSFSATVNGSFKWQGHKVNLDNVNISDYLDKFENLASALESYIEKEAESLFSDILSDVKNYINAIIGDGISGGEFIVNVLYDHYGVTNIESLLDDMYTLLKSNIKLNGKLDFNLVYKLSTIPSYGFHADLGAHIDKHVDIIRGLHADAGLSHSFHTPSLSVYLIDIKENQHLDMTSPEIHVDDSASLSGLSEHVDIGVVGGSLGVKGDVGVDLNVPLNEFKPAIHEHLNATAHGSIHADVAGIGKHGDVNAAHIDESF